jgi:dipeptidyl aminopeptidase/acylaminoacyl peptidase
MSVIKVLSTNSVSAGTEYQVVQTGFYRVIATAGDATVKFNDGPAITILQDQPLLINSGVKPGQSRIVKATDSATSVYTLGTNLGEISDTHPFSSGDFIAVEDDGTSPAIASAFLSAGTAGKKITAATGRTITTDVDASAAAADYTYAYSGSQAVVKRAVKITVATNTCIVEEIQRM